MIRGSILAAIVRREFLEIVRNRVLLLSVIVPPVILATLPILLFGVLGTTASRVPPNFVEMVLAGHPQWRDLPEDQLVTAFALQQFLVTYLILPGYIPLAIATYSIVGEKQSRSLEAVLATPVRTGELLAGKSIAALLPGLLAAWLAYGVMVSVAGLVLGARMACVVTESTWLAAVFALGPAIGLVSVAAGIIVSSRVNDARTAQQIGGVILLPVIGIVVVQAVGSFVVDAPAYLGMAAIMTILGVGLIRIGAAIFGRESILTRWK
ncbi:MAG: hypothetical protein FJ038_09140 [Chloroflexi bacterium]|nr:hypothetical protein [Chloroflexota bacterium]